MRRLARADAASIAVTVALAFAARLAWVLYARADPLDGRLADTVFYHVIAHHLSEGGGYTSPFTFLPTAFFPPGYSFFLTPLYWLFGPHYEVAELANVALGAASTAVLYLLALRLFDARSARIGALVFALLPGQVLFASLVYAEVLFTFVFLAALLLLVVARERDRAGERGWPWLVAFGVAAGAAALVRGVGLGLLLIGPAYWLITTRDLRRTLRPAGLAVAAAALVLTPWTVRNWITMDSPLLLSSAFGVNIWQGHHEGATGGDDDPTPLIVTYGGLSAPRAEVRLGRHGLSDGVHYALDHPVEEVRLAGKKLRHLYGGDRGWLDLNEHYEQRQFIAPGLRRFLLVTGEVTYFAVLALAGAGLLRALARRHEGALLPVLGILVWSGAHVVVFGAPRYHMPVVPVFVLLAAWALAGAPELWRALRARAALSVRQSRGGLAEARRGADS